MKYKAFFKILCVFLIFSILFAMVIPVGAVPVQHQSQSSNVNLSLNCKSAVLMEASTGRILYEQNADEALPPASVTKVMTLLLVMEAIEAGKIKYTDMVRASANACSMGGSQIYLEENEEMSVEDMIKSVVIASANDAAVALAEHIAGTESAFVERMNQRAAELGMKNTYFENTNGLDDTVEKHLTSAKDIAIMSRELIKYPKITEYSSIWMDTVRNGEFGLTNTNRLIRFYKGATGLKTGSTSKAGFCISATAERDGMTLICVIMGSSTRDIRNAAAVSLLDYGFANYTVYKNAGNTLKNIPVVRGMSSEVDAEYADFSYVCAKSELPSITATVDIPEKIEAPIKVGDVIGQVVFKISDKEIGRCDIMTKKGVEKLSFTGIFLTFLKKCATMI